MLINFSLLLINVKCEIQCCTHSKFSRPVPKHGTAPGETFWKNPETWDDFPERQLRTRWILGGAPEGQIHTKASGTPPDHAGNTLPTDIILLPPTPPPSQIETPRAFIQAVGRKPGGGGLVSIAGGGGHHSGHSVWPPWMCASAAVTIWDGRSTPLGATEVLGTQ